MSSESCKGGGGTSQGGKPWGGRFSEATDPTVERFSASIHFDKVLAWHVATTWRTSPPPPSASAGNRPATPEEPER